MNKPIYIAAIAILLVGLVTGLAGIVSFSRRNKELESRLQELEVALTTVREVRTVRSPDLYLEPATTIVTNIVTVNAPDDSTEELTSLRDQLAEKDRQLADLNARLEQARTSRESLTEREERNRRRREEWSRRSTERMEQLKEEEPERYKEIQDRQTARREQMKSTLARQSAFVVNIDTSRMTEEQAENHEQLLKLLTANWEYTQVIESEESTPEEQQEARRGLMRNAWVMNGLLDSERDAALADLAVSLGYDEEESSDFVQTIEYINDMTSLRTYFRGMRGPNPRAAGPPPAESD